MDNIHNSKNHKAHGGTSTKPSLQKSRRFTVWANPKKASRPPVKTRRKSRSRRALLTNFFTKKQDYNISNSVSLGQYSQRIYKFFEKFRNFRLIDQPNLKKIGNPSANGFIIEVPFTKDGLTAYTALKFSNPRQALANGGYEISDNLFYEYCVGKYFVNQYIKKLPCFIETYDLYKIIPAATNSVPSFPSTIKASIQYVLDNLQRIQGINLPGLLERVEIPDVKTFDFGKSCVEPDNYCILIQHFKDFKSLGDILDKDFDNVKYEMQNLLFQLFYCLDVIIDKYTHYDAHDGNIFAYKPYSGNKCILMRYHTKSGKVVEFKSEYVVKLIDYGRNYFNDGTFSSTEVLNKVCKASECQPLCGDDSGYGNINTGLVGNPSSYYWINPTTANMSHDMRSIGIRSNLNAFVTRYLIGSDVKIKYDKKFGTPESTDNSDPKLITNIPELVNRMVDPLIQWNTEKNHKKYDSTWEVMATMNIYHDGRDYEFRGNQGIRP